jgi:hypothetical protein
LQVRAKLQRAMKGESTPEDQSGEQEKFVTVDEVLARRRSAAGNLH